MERIGWRGSRLCQQFADARDHTSAISWILSGSPDAAIDTW
jgi:hypothetical protein